MPLLSTGSVLVPQVEAVVVTCGFLKQFLVKHWRIPDDEIVTPVNNSSSNLNVVFLFLDSMSRRHFFRTMPKVRSWFLTDHSAYLLFQTKAVLEHFCWNCNQSHVAFQYLQVPLFAALLRGF